MWNCTAKCKTLSPLRNGFKAQKPNHVRWQESSVCLCMAKNPHNMLFSQFEISYYLISKSVRIEIKILTGQTREFPAEGTHHLTHYNLEHIAWPTKAPEQV